MMLLKYSLFLFSCVFHTNLFASQAALANVLTLYASHFKEKEQKIDLQCAKERIYPKLAQYQEALDILGQGNCTNFLETLRSKGLDINKRIALDQHCINVLAVGWLRCSGELTGELLTLLDKGLTPSSDDLHGILSPERNFQLYNLLVVSSFLCTAFWRSLARF